MKVEIPHGVFHSESIYSRFRATFSIIDKLKGYLTYWRKRYPGWCCPPDGTGLKNTVILLGLGEQNEVIKLKGASLIASKHAYVLFGEIDDKSLVPGYASSIRVVLMDRPLLERVRVTLNKETSNCGSANLPETAGPEEILCTAFSEDRLYGDIVISRLLAALPELDGAIRPSGEIFALSVNLDETGPIPEDTFVVLLYDRSIKLR